jgi:hypothetical protein
LKWQQQNNGQVLPKKKVKGDMLTVKDLERAMIEDYCLLKRHSFVMMQDGMSCCYFNFKARAKIMVVTEAMNVQIGATPKNLGLVE